MRARDLHPDSGYGVVPYEHRADRWEVRLWDGQTGESKYVVTDIPSRKMAESIRDQLAGMEPYYA